jgi:hypothetical protein
MGDLKSRVHFIVHSYLNSETTDEQFKAQVIDVIAHFEKRMSRYILLQDIGLIVREREGKRSKSERFERLWTILAQIEPSIRENLDHFDEAMRE